jgi:hypothetical protein
MILSLRLGVDGMYFNDVAVVEIPELMRREFEPLKTSDDFMICAAIGDIPMQSREAKIVIKTREDSAKILADELARMIVNEMKKNDTYNGYREHT